MFGRALHGEGSAARGRYENHSGAGDRLRRFVDRSFFYLSLIVIDGWKMMVGVATLRASPGHCEKDEGLGHGNR